jgi:hypothetical protein
VYRAHERCRKRSSTDSRIVHNGIVFFTRSSSNAGDAALISRHLHKALEILRKVHSDVAREEDDPAVRGLRDRAIGYIDGAIHAPKRP